MAVETPKKATTAPETPEQKLAREKWELETQTKKNLNALLAEVSKSQQEVPKTQDELVREIKTSTGEKREKAVYEAITKSDLPAFHDVRAKMKDANGTMHDVRFSITRDCISIGGRRMPMNPETAQLVAHKFSLMLPTKELVDNVFADPDFNKIIMPTLPPGPQMTSEDYYQKHDDMVEYAIKSLNLDSSKGQIGHKKILIVNERLKTSPDKLAFHGGLKPDGTLWQNADLAHDPKYVDYSHGVMLVNRKFVVDGEEMDIMDVIKKYPGIIGQDASFDPFSFYGRDQTESAIDSESVLHPLQPVAPPARFPQKTSEPEVTRPDVPAETHLKSEFPQQATLPEPVLPTVPQAQEPPSSAAEAPSKKSMAEKRESIESRPIKGSTLFAGDSNMVGTPSQHLEVDGRKETLAEVGKTSDWLLKKMRELDSDGKLKQFENFVCLIGANDIGGSKTAEQIFENIQKIWEIAKKNGLKVYGCTVPPFRGWGNYSSRYAEINAKRLELNALIDNSRAPDRIIKLHELVSAEDRALLEEFDSGDHLHLKKEKLAKLLQQEVSAWQEVT